MGLLQTIGSLFTGGGGVEGGGMFSSSARSSLESQKDFYFGNSGMTVNQPAKNESTFVIAGLAAAAAVVAIIIAIRK